MTTPFPEEDRQHGQSGNPADSGHGQQPPYGGPQYGGSQQPGYPPPGGPQQPPNPPGPPPPGPPPNPYGGGEQTPNPYGPSRGGNPYAPGQATPAPPPEPGWGHGGGNQPPPGGGYGAPPPSSGGGPGKGVIIAIVVGVIAAIALVAAVVWYVVGSRSDDGATIDPAPSVDAVPTGPDTSPSTAPTEPSDTPTSGDAYGLPPALAYEGDCLTDADDVADVVTVACDDPDAQWQVVLRDDNPGEGSNDEVVRASCAGTGADDAIYALSDDAILRYVVCLVPVD